jgi:hypothetical protein
MTDWYLETPAHWILCRVISQAFGSITLQLYDAEKPETIKATARRAAEGYGWLVKPQAGK